MPLSFALGVNIMASYRKRGKNSWQLVLNYGFDALGNRIQPTKTIRVTDPAILRAPKRLEEHLRDEIAKFKMEYELGASKPEARISFKQLTEEWLRKHVDVNLEEKTKENYRFQLKRRILPYFERKWLDEINTRHLSDFLVYLRSPEARKRGEGPLKSATIVFNYRVLKSIFRFAMAEKYIKENPMDGVRKPKEDDVQEMKVYDEKEIKELIVALENEPPHIRIMVLLAVIGGMRRSEIAGLEWPNVDLEKGIIHVKQAITMNIDGKPVIKRPKSKNSVRRISIPEMFVEELKAYKDEQQKNQEGIELWEGRQFLFAHPDGKPVHPKRLTHWWDRFHKRHNLKHIRFHDLRHTSVSWLIYKKIHSEAIARRVGHKNEKMLQIYGHIFKSVEREAAATFDDILAIQKKENDSKTDHSLPTS
jgi:integrase